MVRKKENDMATVEKEIEKLSTNIDPGVDSISCSSCFMKYEEYDIWPEWLYEEGWRVIRGKSYCPHCAEKRKKPNK